MPWLDMTKTILGYVTFPVVVLLKFVVYILHWIATPFIYVGIGIKELFLFPFRLLAQFEALWYFLCCGILIGLLAGCTIWGICRLFVLSFDLDRKPAPEDIPAKGHSAATYRAARAEKQRKKQAAVERRATRAKLLASQPLIQEMVREARNQPITLLSPASPHTSTVATRSGLFQDIILEHSEEEDESDF